MNVVLEDGVEVYLKKDVRKALGRVLLKGDNITLISPVTSEGDNGMQE
jgi:small nuclear ribonucleoprotein E